MVGKTKQVSIIPGGLVEKVPRYDGQDAGLEKQAERLKALGSMGFRAPAIYEVSPDRVTMEYIPGKTLREMQDNLSSEMVAGLKALQAQQVSLGIYIGDLNQKNLIWFEGWWIVDCGAIRVGRSAEYIHKKLSKQWERWLKEV